MRQLPPPPAGKVGIYVHIPFCVSRCTYCDFLSIIEWEGALPRYLDAVERELLQGHDSPRAEADSIYLGGGTPSLLDHASTRRIIKAAQVNFTLSTSAEVTIEANPDDVDEARLREWSEAGVNRLSLGVQTLDDAVLSKVGRRHRSRDSLVALENALDSPIRRVNVDLILGLPGENLAAWPRSIDRIASLGPDHVSVYILETDKETELARSLREGRETVAGDETIMRVFGETVELLESRGLRRYEISNFAVPRGESRHNIKYWTDQPYCGFGLGAHGYLAGERRSNTGNLDRYIEIVTNGRDPVVETEPWDPVMRLEEALFMGLRMIAGVDLDILGERYGIDLWQAYDEIWHRAGDNGMVVANGSVLSLTEEGLNRSNELFREIIGHLDR